MRLPTRNLVAVACAAMLTGCASVAPVGVLYTEMTLPLDATSADGGSKEGEAVCTTVLGLIATGDCSLETARSNGGITTVTHADWHTSNILGLIGTYTLTVYGE